MEVLEMLERLPAIADAIRRSRTELGEPGFTVAVHDGEDRVRLRVWPPHR